MFGKLLVLLGLRPAQRFQVGNVLEYNVATPEWRYLVVTKAEYRVPPGQVEKTWCYTGSVFYIHDGSLCANGYFRHEPEDKFRPVESRHDGRQFQYPVLTTPLSRLEEA